MALFTEEQVRNLRTHNMMMIVPYEFDVDEINESGNAVVHPDKAIKDLVAYGCHDCELPLEAAMNVPCTGTIDDPGRMH